MNWTYITICVWVAATIGVIVTKSVESLNIAGGVTVIIGIGYLVLKMKEKV